MEAEIKYDEENFVSPEFCSGCGQNIAMDMEEVVLKQDVLVSNKDYSTVDY